MSNPALETLAQRKREHLLQSMEPKNQAKGLAGFERVHLTHEALPEIDFTDLNLTTSCLTRSLATPFYVAGMTGGHPDAAALNLRIAKACETRGWAMGVGSQRADFIAGAGGQGPEKSTEKSTEKSNEWRVLRKGAPHAVFFANLGVSQLTQDFSTKTLDRLKYLVESLEAQALALHLNVLQEALQPEGTPHFKGALKAIERVCRELGTPVILKETGCGFSQATLKRLQTLGLAAIDVSGLGGTHWGRIEGARSANPVAQRAAETFANWGESTVDSVLAAREVFGESNTGKQPEIWASGGVRSGLDAAKLLGLGADRVGYAQPALEAALAGSEALCQWMEIQEFELKVALFSTGSCSVSELRAGYGTKTRLN